MSQINVNTITDEAGTGPVNFPYDFTIAGSALVIPPAHNPVSVSGATQALNVGSYNFFNGGTLSADITLTFTSVPTNALWTYTANASSGDGWMIEGASYSGFSKSVFNEGNGSPNGVAFSTDGTKMYVNGAATSLIYQYTLSTAFNVSTATYDSVSFSLASQGIDHSAVVFSPDGTKMYSAGGDGVSIYQYTLSTAWDLSTATYASLSKNVSAQQTALFGVAFSSDGTKMYISGYTPSAVHQYTLSTAWNVGTATYASLTVNTSETNYPMGVAFSSDGTRMIILDYNNNKVLQYNLSTAWDVSTATYSALWISLVDSLGGNSRGIGFSTDGSKMYIASNGSDAIYEYYTGIGYAITTPASVQNPPTTQVRSGNQVSYTFVTNDGGTTVKLIGEEAF